jgi:hypothetical protein
VVRRMPRGKLVGAAAVVALLVAAGLALAATRSGFTQTFTTGKDVVAARGKSTGTSFQTTSDDEDNTTGNMQPARLVKLTDSLPDGTVLNQDAKPRCGAGDQDFKDRGAAACPKSTVVGRGDATLRPPFGADAQATVTAFDGRGNGLLVYVDPPSGAPDPFLVRARITGTPGKKQALVATFPILCQNGLFSGGQPVCGVGGKEWRLAGLRLKIDPFATGKGKKRKVLLRTPASCPKSRRWTFMGRLDYADGTSATIPSPVVCVK